MEQRRKGAHQKEEREVNWRQNEHTVEDQGRGEGTIKDRWDTEDHLR